MILLPAGEGGVSTQFSTNGLSQVSFIAVGGVSFLGYRCSEADRTAAEASPQGGRLAACVQSG